MPQILWYLSTEQVCLPRLNNKISTRTSSQEDRWFRFLFNFPLFTWKRKETVGTQLSTTAVLQRTSRAGESAARGGLCHSDARCCPYYRDFTQPPGTNSNSTSKALGTTIRAMPRKVNVVLFTHHPETLSLRTTALHLITVNPWRKEMIPQSERHT